MRALYIGLGVLVLSCGSSGTNDDGGGGGMDATMGMDGTSPPDGTTQDSPNPMDASDSSVPVGASVIERNNHPNRDGFFVQPTLTKAKAATMIRDMSFDGTISGNVYASPLFVDGNPGMFIVATENNQVTALNENTGMPTWQKTYGQNAGASGAGCGNIAPLGITGTPTIDLATRTLYFDSVVGTNQTIQNHVVHAVSVDDGSERMGWPIQTSTITYMNETFNPVVHNQRSSLLLVNKILYVAFGGHAGDCNSYRGWLIGIDTTNPTTIKVYKTGAQRGGGMWAPGGPSTDGTNVYVSTGNTFGANSNWSGGEAVFRLQAGPTFSGQATDYFAPSNWQALDNADLDLGGSGPLVVDAPGFMPSALVVGLGKDGYVYALDRNNLGGIGGQKASFHAVAGEIINAAASFTTPAGTFVTMHGHNANGTGCATGSGDLVTVKLSGTQITSAWCANNNGAGSPIVTATDAQGTDAVVWTAGAEGSNRLHGWEAVTGAVVYSGGGAGDTFAGVRRFTSPIAVKGRIIIAGNNKVFVYKMQ